MIKNYIKTVLPLLALFLLPGCEIIGGIFHAGVWVGALLVIIVIVVIVYLVGSIGDKGNK